MSNFSLLRMSFFNVVFIIVFHNAINCLIYREPIARQTSIECCGAVSEAQSTTVIKSTELNRIARYIDLHSFYDTNCLKTSLLQFHYDASTFRIMLLQWYIFVFTLQMNSFRARHYEIVTMKQLHIIYVICLNVHSDFNKGN